MFNSRRPRNEMYAGCRVLLTFFLVSATPAIAGAPTRVASVEGITEYRLDNGLQLLLFPDPSVQTFTVNVTYRVGSRHEGRGEAGMAHLLEHMVFKGTPTHTNIWGALEDHGARFNGTTWVDRTNYFETLQATDENLEFALAMEADRMVNSTISGEELAREMTVVRNEFEMGENSPVGVLSERMVSAAYLWHNYGKSTIGNRSDIERVPVENLRRFYRRFYQPDNATLVVAGKFDLDKTLAVIGRTFGAIPRPTRTLERTYTEEPPQDGPRLVTLKRTGDVAAAGLVYHVPAGTHPDFAAVQVLAGVLTDRPSGRLYKALIEPGLAASVFGNASAYAEPGLMQVMAQVRLEQNPRQALDVMIDVIEGIANTPITDEEVERIKAQRLKNIKLSMTNSGRVGVSLSEAVAQGDWRIFFIHRDRLKSVTTSEVQRVARSYLVESNRTAGLFLPTADSARASIPPTPDIAALVDGYEGTESIAQGEAFVATPDTLEQRAKRLTLPSGIRLAMLPKKTRGQAVRASFRFLFGDEQALNGHTTALGMVPTMLMRGTKNRSYQQLRDEIDRLESRIAVGGGGRRGRGGGGGGAGGSVGASIESDRAHFVEAIRLLGEIMQQPAFAAAEFEKVTRERLARREQGLSDPRSRGMNALSRAMNPWPESSIHYVPTLEQGIERLRSVSLGEVMELYSRYYGADHLFVSVVGDFDETQLVQTLEDVFGGWKSGAPYERIEKPFMANDTAPIVIKTPDKEMAVVAMGTTFEMRDDDPDYPALRFAAYILGQSAKSRMMTRLRHEGGLSYGAGASIRADDRDRRASLAANAICAPQNAEEAGNAMREEMQRWIAEGVTDTELEEGKKSYALQFENNLASDRFVLGQLNSGLETGRTFAWHADLMARIQGLSLSDIQQALNRRLGSASFVEMQAGDFDRVVPASDPAAAAEAHGSTAALPERLARLDANGDGKIQKSEAPERMQQFFERLDANGDGAIDGSEAAEMRGGQRGAGRRGGQRPPS